MSTLNVPSYAFFQQTPNMQNWIDLPYYEKNVNLLHRVGKNQLQLLIPLVRFEDDGVLLCRNKKYSIDPGTLFISDIHIIHLVNKT